MPQQGIELFKKEMKNRGYSDAYIENYIQQKTGGQTQEQRKKDEPFGFIPPITGLIGGVAGAAASGPTTGFLGSAALGGGGAALGTTAGIGIQNLLQDLFGKQKETKSEQLNDAMKRGAISGASDIGGSIALKGAATLAGPVIRPVGRFLYQTGLKIPKGLAKKALDKGDDIGATVETMMNEGLRGKPQKWMQAGKEGAQKIWSMISKSAGENANAVPVSELENAYLDSITSGGNLNASVRPEDIDKMLSKAEEVFKAIKREGGDIISYKDFIDLNKSANATLYTGAGSKSTSQAIKNQVWDDLDNIVKDYISGGNQEVKDLLRQYGIYKNIEEIGKDAAAGTAAKKLPSSIQRLFDQTLGNPNFATIAGYKMAKFNGNLPSSIGSKGVSYLYNTGLQQQRNDELSKRGYLK